jgi:hypothetical protein
MIGAAVVERRFANEWDGGVLAPSLQLPHPPADIEGDPHRDRFETPGEEDRGHISGRRIGPVSEA